MSHCWTRTGKRNRRKNVKISQSSALSIQKWIKKQMTEAKDLVRDTVSEKRITNDEWKETERGRERQAEEKRVKESIQVASGSERETLRS